MEPTGSTAALAMNGACGRFAPSPSGPLHFGSLAAALGSYLDARAIGGLWRVRIEDLDAPRAQPGAAGQILETLERCGFEWDGPVLLQSERAPRYRAALDRLRALGLVYACGCSRREVADSALAADGARVYPGTCRQGLAPGKTQRACRLRTSAGPIAFIDRLQGRVSQSVEREVGDFVLLRADGLFAYQLAVVVDDAEQEITDVVRGADLLESTARQIYLQRLLGLPPLRYLHLPVAIDANGEKLSKQSGAAAAGPQDLRRALAFLGHAPPPQLRDAPPRELLAWGVAHWKVASLPVARFIAISSPED